MSDRNCGCRLMGMRVTIALVLFLSVACDTDPEEAPDFVDACVRSTEHLAECAGEDPVDGIMEICEAFEESLGSDGSTCIDLEARLYDCLADASCQALTEGVCEREENDYDEECSDAARR